MHALILVGCVPSPIQIPADPIDVPLIGEALAPLCGEVDPIAVAPPGEAFHRRLSTTTVCNDGTPSQLFLRRATDPDHADDWILHLEGGGNCSDWAGCVERWCGFGFYNAGKMSSRFHEPRIGGAGLASRSPGNAMAGWNQAYLSYCSSDQWVGQARDTVFDGDPPFRMHFEGHRILADALSVLDAGAISDDGEVRMDPLVEADTIVLAGLSAGGFGVSANLDWLAESYPDKLVLGVIDAMLYPSLGYFADPVVQQGIEQGLQLQFVEDYGAWLGFVDASCALQRGDDEPWRCLDVGHIYFSHLQTPFFLNFDLQDDVISPFYTDLGATGEDFGDAAQASLRDLAAQRSDVSVRGQSCGHHANLEDDVWYAQVAVTDAEVGGGPVTLHDGIVSFLDSDRVVVVDDWMDASSTCP